MTLQNQDISINQASAQAVFNEVYNITAPKGPFEVVNKVRNSVIYPAFSALPNSLGGMFKSVTATTVRLG